MSHKHQFSSHENFWLQSKYLIEKNKNEKKLVLSSSSFIPMKARPIQFILLLLLLQWHPRTFNSQCSECHTAERRKNYVKKMTNKLQMKLDKTTLTSTKTHTHTHTRNFNQIFTVIQLGKDFFSKPYTLLFILYCFLFLFVVHLFVWLVGCSSFCFCSLIFFFSWERENSNWQLNRFSFDGHKINQTDRFNSKTNV